MKELKRIMRYYVIKYQRQKLRRNNNEILKINEWVSMKYYAPFAINEKITI